MNVYRVNCYSGKLSNAFFVDTSKHGVYNYRLPAGLSLEIGEAGVQVAGGIVSNRIGENFAPPVYLEVRGGESVCVLVVSEAPKGYEFYSIAGRAKISVGPSAKHDVVNSLEAHAGSASVPYCQIVRESGGVDYLEITSPEKCAYLNGIQAEKSTPLGFGDEIDVLGQSIIYLKDSLAVLMTTVTAVGLDISDAASAAPPAAPREDVLFKRTVRIFNEPEVKDFAIEEPTQSSMTSNRLPAALVAGPAITMAVSMMSSMAMSLSSRGGVLAAAMSGSMLLGVLLWTPLTRRYETKRGKETERARVAKYGKYLARTEAEIAETLDKNMVIFKGAKASSGDIVEWIDNKFLRRMWERAFYDSDFLEVRIGSGKIKNVSKITAPRITYQNCDDPLIQKAEEIARRYEYIENAPVTLDLKKNNSVGIVGFDVLVKNAAVNMAMQIAAMHDSAEVKMAFIFDDKDSDYFDWVKKLPHVWNDDMDFRFIAKDKPEVQTLLRRLLEEMGIRTGTRGGGNKNAPVPAYVLFILDQELISDASISSFILSEYETAAFVSIFASNEVSDIPSGCKTIIQTYADNASLYDRTASHKFFTSFDKETVFPENLARFASTMSTFVTMSSAKNTNIPTSVGFMDLFRAGSIEEIGVFRRWSEANPQKSLAVPIGIKGGGENFYLDIHEKYHGSHGLMAGTTGSGKSECLQAIILSLIVNFHPDDVCFVLIYFKGGGMANLFGDVPHIAGTITNLGNQIKRSMLSLNAEMTRRQAMLKNAGVNHIDKYQRLYKEGKAAAPMPHMVLVSDEFAELKQQQPEFMAQLISVARIGRSLGVHLILATQKPTGVVDDQIWSNTRFRICLKVADKADSSGMIGSPLAAAITLPGRGYVQVGYNEVFEHVQTAYTGADYIPLDEYVDLDTQQVTQIDSCGQVVASAAVAPKRKTGTGGAKKQNQLEAVVEYVENLAREKGIARRPIWADPLPCVLPLDDVKRLAVPDPADDGTKREALVGLIDDPAAQTVVPLSVSLDDGHVAIYGMPGCGKTTFTQTMLYYLVTVYSPAQFRLEVIDFGGRTLEIFAAAPHTGHVLSPADADEMTALLQDLLDEIEARKEKFAAARQETLRKYVKSSGELLPVILLVADGYGKFREEAPDQSDMLTELLKEGAKYGIIVMLCADSVSAVSYKFNDYISEKVTLQLGDPIDYASVVGSVMGMFPEPVKGRGLVRHEGRVTEFQSAVVYGETDDGVRSRKIVEELQKMERPAAKAKPERPAGMVGVAGVSGISGISDKSRESGPERKERPSRGLGGIPGFGAKKSSPPVTAAKKSNKRLPMTQFTPEGGRGVRVASGRVGGIDYLLPHGQGMYVLHTGSLDPAILRAIAADAAAGGRRVWRCAPASPDAALPDGVTPANTEAEMAAMTEALREGGACVVVEDLMEFYKVISDAALDKLVALLRAESSDISFIAGVEREDARILKDYPLGILLFRTWNRGILAEGKPIDSSTILPGELLARMSMDERGIFTSGKMALLFQGDGAFEKVVPYAGN